MIAGLLLFACQNGDFVRPRNFEPNAAVQIPASLGPILRQHTWLARRTAYLGQDGDRAWLLIHESAGFDADLREIEPRWSAVRLAEGGAVQTFPEPPLPQDVLPIESAHDPITLSPGVLGAAWMDDPSTEAVDPFALAWSERQGRWLRFPLSPDELVGRVHLGDGRVLTGLDTDQPQIHGPDSSQALPLATRCGGPELRAGPADADRLRLVCLPDAHTVCSGVLDLDTLDWTGAPACHAFERAHLGLGAGVVGGTVDEALWVLYFDGASALMRGADGAVEPVGALPGGIAPDPVQGLAGALRMGMGPDETWVRIATADGALERWGRQPHVAQQCECNRSDDPKTCDCVGVPVRPPLNRMLRPGRSLRVFGVALDGVARHHALWAEVHWLERVPLGPFLDVPDLPHTPQPTTVTLQAVGPDGLGCAVRAHTGGVELPLVGDALEVTAASLYELTVHCAATDGHAPFVDGTWTRTGAELLADGAPWSPAELAVRGTPLDGFVADQPVGFLDIPGFALDMPWSTPHWFSFDGATVSAAPLPGLPTALDDGRVVVPGGELLDPTTGALAPGFVGLADPSAAGQDPWRGLVWAPGPFGFDVYTAAGGMPAFTVPSELPQADLRAVTSDGDVAVFHTPSGLRALVAPVGTFSLPWAGNCSKTWITDTAQIVGACSSGLHRWTADDLDAPTAWNRTTLTLGISGLPWMDPVADVLVYGDLSTLDVYSSTAGAPGQWFTGVQDLATCGTAGCLESHDSTQATAYGADLVRHTTTLPAPITELARGDGPEPGWARTAAGWYDLADPEPRPVRLAAGGPYPTRGGQAEIRPVNGALAVGPVGLDPAAFAAVAIPVAPEAGTVVPPAMLRPALAQSPCLPLEVELPGDAGRGWICAW